MQIVNSKSSYYLGEYLMFIPGFSMQTGFQLLKTGFTGLNRSLNFTPS